MVITNQSAFSDCPVLADSVLARLCRPKKCFGLFCLKKVLWEVRILGFFKKIFPKSKAALKYKSLYKIGSVKITVTNKKNSCFILN
jgi:hypothetical protein